MLFGASYVAHHDRYLGEPGLLVSLFLGAVFVEAIGAQETAIGDARGALAGALRGALQVIDHQRRLGLPRAGKVRACARGDVLQIGLAQVLGVSQADQQDAAVLELGGRQDVEQLVLLAGETARRNGALDGAAGLLVELGRRRRELLAGHHAGDDGATGGQGMSCEGYLHGGPLDDADRADALNNASAEMNSLTPAISGAPPACQ
jgi:hypothetical protein